MIRSAPASILLHPLPLALLTTVLAAAPLTAQGGGEIGGRVMEVRGRDRWLHARQKPEFTPFQPIEQWVQVDSARAAPATGERTLFFNVRDAPFGGGLAVRVEADRAGRVRRVESVWPARPRRPSESPEDSAQAARWLLMDGDRLALPAAQAWELLPTFRPERERSGARWVDTLAFATEHEGMRQALGGVRVSTLVRDTTVAGRRLWIVRDSAAVRYEERALRRERTLDTLVAVERAAAGVVRGRHLYDPRLGAFVARADTTRLAGEAVLRYPDGRAFRTPARYERERRWTLRDSAAHARYAEALADQREAGFGGGMRVIEPHTVEGRLHDGDAALRDSLLAAWRTTADPDERQRIDRLLAMSTGGMEARLVEMRLEAGDTAGALAALDAVPPVPYRKRDARVQRLFLPVMADPGLALAYGLERDVFYEDAMYGLENFPPAAQPDSTGWACTPEACRLLEAQWERAGVDPRLRDVGLFARMARDPARWEGEVLARVRAGSVVLRPAARLLQGVAAAWTAGSKAPLPPPEAGWRDWLEWMEGVDPAYRARVPTARGGVRFEDSHATAIRFQRARTGRDVAAELRAKLAAPEADSARLVYGAILLGLGEHALDADAVARGLRSASRAERELARRQVPLLFAQARPAGADTAAALLDRFLAVLLDEGAKPFPELPGDSAGWSRQRYPVDRASPTFVQTQGLPPVLLARWAGRVGFVPSPERDRLTERDAVLDVEFAPVVRVGPFVKLAVGLHGSLARQPDQVPAAYLQTYALWLMEMEGDWVVVYYGESIT